MDVKFNRENDKSANFMTLLSCGQGEVKNV